MKFNQFSYIPVSPETAYQELRSLGFEVSLDASAKANFESFVRKYFLFFEDTDLALKNWIADPETDLLSFFQSDRPLTAEQIISKSKLLIRKFFLQIRPRRSMRVPFPFYPFIHHIRG